MDVLNLLIVVFLGLAFGSFATALSYRLPREISIVKRRRSQCTSCHKKLGVIDLVPIFSWILLGGKCRRCRKPIGLQYPLIEAATLVLCLLFYSVYGFGIQTVAILALAPVLVSIFDIDLRHKIIPDSLNLSIFLIGLFLLLVNAFIDGPSFLLDKGATALGGSFLYGAGSLLLRQIAMMVMKREPMGLGDIKFYAASGFWLGLDPNAAAVFLTVSGMFSVIFSLAWKKKTGDVETPFGPALIIAFILVLFFFPPDFIRL